MKSIRKHLVLILAGFLSVMTLLPANAQEDSINEEKTKVMPFQLTLISPLGTNGLQSGKVANNVSINIFGGISGGVKGVELGSFVNFSNGDITGLQASGLINGSLGELKGSQLSGIANYNRGGTIGLQASGIGNVNTAPVIGVQMAGIFSYAMTHVEGVQASGILNTTIGDVKGLQISGIANLATKPVEGAQITGIANTTIGDFSGLQLAGIVNVTTKKMDGAQIGLVNYARTIKGFQFGLINVADSVEKGASLGLFTYIRHGYHKIEIEANETLYANITFKSGVEKLYMIYTAGFKHDNGISYWAPGFGIGTLSHVSSKLDINADLIVRQVNEGEWWTEELNLLNSLSLNLAYNFSDKLAVYGGPSLNVSVSGIKDEEGNLVGESFSPDWEFFEETYNNNKVKMYLGFKAGIRF